LLNSYLGTTGKNYMTVFLFLLFTFSSLCDDDSKSFTVGLTNTLLLLINLYFLTIKKRTVGNEYWDDSLQITIQTDCCDIKLR
jgi:protein-S-isoprenylcysteine O-methyltransferase Ste14